MRRVENGLLPELRLLHSEIRTSDERGKQERTRWPGVSLEASYLSNGEKYFDSRMLEYLCKTWSRVDEMLSNERPAIGRRRNKQASQQLSLAAASPYFHARGRINV
jgi:hypothetical protein